MSSELILTGTGYPRPHPRRAGPGALVRSDGRNLQFDAGRATAMRLAALDVSCRDLDALFVTHFHSDHLVGLADIVLSRWIALDRPSPDRALQVVAPAGASADYVRGLIDPWRADIEVRRLHTRRRTSPALRCREFMPAAKPRRVWSRGSIRVSAVRVEHPPVVNAVGYRVDTVDGAIAISGDTAPCAQVLALSRGADVLVHEAVLGAHVRGTPSQTILSYHADAEALGALLVDADVPLLVLTHLIPAPCDRREERRFAAAVRHGGYRGEVRVGRDLMRVTLPR